MATAPISDVETRNDYTATGGQTTFPYTFWIKEEDHLDVYVNDVLQTLGVGNDYTVDAVQSVTGSNVVFNSGLTADDEVAIVYNPDIERQTEFTTSGTFNASSINLELTYLISICQYLDMQLGRALRWADTLDVSNFADFTFADPTGSAGYAVVVNSTEDGFEYNQIVDGTLIGNYESFVTDGDASTTTFAVGFTPVSVNSIIVEVDGVILEPTVDYQISGSNVTFTAAPGTGTDNVVVRNLASGVAATTPGDASVSTAKIQDGAVTTAKIATGDTVTKDKIDDDLITNYTDTVITASDELLFSDVSDSNNMKKDTIQGVLDLVAPDLQGKAATTLVSNDTFTFYDTSDSNNPKVDNINGILDLTGAWLFNQTTVTPTTSDYLYFGDVSGGNATKKALIDTVLGLSGGGGGASWTYGSNTSLNSQSEELFTGLSGVNEIEIWGNNVSTASSTGGITIQIGDSGGYETSGYVSNVVGFDGAGWDSEGSATDGFELSATTWLLSNQVDFYMRLFKPGDATETWCSIQWISPHNSVSTFAHGGGIKTLSAALDRVRLRSSSPNFDNGQIYGRWR